MAIMASLCLVFGTLAIMGGNYINKNPLYIKRLNAAIEDNNYSEVQSLLELPHHGNIDGVPSLFPFLHLLIKEKIVYSPLENACRNANINIISLLIKNGANVNGDEKKGLGREAYSPLMLAVMAGGDDRLEIIKLLVENGADLDYSYGGQLAITLTAETNFYDSTQVLEYLESVGQKIEVMYPRGSLLHYACYGGNSRTIQYLIETKYLYINEKDINGRTPLICFSFPVKEKNLEDLIYLLNNGADKTIVDNEGKTAYDYASSSNTPSFLQLIKP